MLPVFLLVASLASVEGLSKDHCLGYDVLCTTADYEAVGMNCLRSSVIGSEPWNCLSINTGESDTAGELQPADYPPWPHFTQGGEDKGKNSILCQQFRRYSESVWVGIHVSWVFFHGTDMALLYRYFKQQNSEGMQIQWTGQVLVSFTEHGRPTIYYMLPQELWDNPPTATDPRVFVIHLPKMDVFARKIHLFHFYDVGDFNRMLTAQNAHINNSNFFVYSFFREPVVFDHLMQGREIWFVSTGGFDCPAP